MTDSIMSFAERHGSGRSLRPLGVFCLFQRSDWWNVLYSIMGNVVFTTNSAVKHDYFKNKALTEANNTINYKQTTS